MSNILVSIIMGSKSDWAIMQHAGFTLADFSVPYEALVISAHRTPDQLFSYASKARDRGIKVIIAGAGGAAHLPGMCKSKTTLPVLGVPIPATVLNGLDSLLSIVQMPRGTPVGTLAIGEVGAINSAVMAVEILSLQFEQYVKKLDDFKASMAMKVLENCVLH